MNLVKFDPYYKYVFFSTHFNINMWIAIPLRTFLHQTLFSLMSSVVNMSMMW